MDSIRLAPTRTRSRVSRLILAGLLVTLGACGGSDGPPPDGRSATSPDRATGDGARLQASDPDIDLSGVTEGDWIRLYNGENLDGWALKIRGHELGDDPYGTVAVSDGVIRIGYDGYEGPFADRFGHLFHESSYGWYHLLVEYRFVGEQAQDGPGWAFRNSGIMVHGQSAESMGLDQDFPISIEVQLLGGNGTDERSTANLCTPGTNVVFDDVLDTRHCIDSTSDTYHGDQWVTAELTVLGDSLVVHIVNGDEVLRYNSPQIGGGNVSGHDPAEFREGEYLQSGSISLQSESHPIEFRRVDLLALEGCMDPGSDAYRPWYVRSKPGACTNPM